MFCTKKVLVTSFSIAALTLSACTTMTPKQMSDVLEKHPEVLTNAIEKNPEIFMEAVQKAAQAAQGKAQQQEVINEKKRVEDEFKNPLKPEIQAERGFMGEASAKITIVEYTDFQCPYCSHGYSTLEKVRQTYGKDVKVLVKSLPLPNHPMAMPAAKAFEALRLSDTSKANKFYHELFQNQNKLTSEKYIYDVVKKVGGDVKKIKADAEGKVVADRIAADIAEARKFNIEGTPGFIVNGVSIRGAYPFEFFKAIIDPQLAAK
jgi:protein-disulfide isomerase